MIEVAWKVNNEVRIRLGNLMFPLIAFKVVNQVREQLWGQIAVQVGEVTNRLVGSDPAGQIATGRWETRLER